jgi:thymidylate synthase
LSLAQHREERGQWEEEKDNPNENQEEKEKKKAITVGADGSSGERPLAETTEMHWKRREQELLEHLKEKESIILQKQQELNGLEEEAQYYKQMAEKNIPPIAAKSDEPLQEDYDDSSIRATTLNQEGINLPRRNVEFEFWLTFDVLRTEMDKLYRKQGRAAKIWIHGTIDAVTCKVLDAAVGRVHDAPRD